MGCSPAVKFDGYNVVVAAFGPRFVAREDRLAVDEHANAVVGAEQQQIFSAARYVERAGRIRDDVGLFRFYARFSNRRSRLRCSTRAPTRERLRPSRFDSEAGQQSKARVSPGHKNRRASGRNFSSSTISIGSTRRCRPTSISGVAFLFPLVGVWNGPMTSHAPIAIFRTRRHAHRIRRRGGDSRIRRRHRHRR